MGSEASVLDDLGEGAYNGIVKTKTEFCFGMTAEDTIVLDIRYSFYIIRRTHFLIYLLW